jgi:beta-galactosidase
MAQYLVPSECGNKSGVRRAKITDAAGRGIELWGDDLSLSVLPHSPHEIDCAAHTNELPPVLYTYVRVGLAQMGVGGDDTWGAKTHPEFCIDNTKPLELTFSFRAV